METVATVVGPGTSAGQGPFSTPRGGGATSGSTEDPDESGAAATAAPAVLTPRERYRAGPGQGAGGAEAGSAGGIMGPGAPADGSDTARRPPRRRRRAGRARSRSRVGRRGPNGRIGTGSPRPVEPDRATRRSRSPTLDDPRSGYGTSGGRGWAGGRRPVGCPKAHARRPIDRRSSRVPGSIGRREPAVRTRLRPWGRGRTSPAWRP